LCRHQWLFYTSKSPIGIPSTAALWPNVTSGGIDGRGRPPLKSSHLLVHFSLECRVMPPIMPPIRLQMLNIECCSLLKVECWMSRCWGRSKTRRPSLRFSVHRSHIFTFTLVSNVESCLQWGLQSCLKCWISNVECSMSCVECQMSMLNADV
jgi:hypothetical protein